jgi:hypothetical protein
MVTGIRHADLLNSLRAGVDEQGYVAASVHRASVAAEAAILSIRREQNAALISVKVFSAALRGQS